MMLTLTTLLVIIVAAFVLEQNFSYNKIENLDEQGEIIKSLTNTISNLKKSSSTERVTCYLSRSITSNNFTNTTS